MSLCVPNSLGNLSVTIGAKAYQCLFLQELKINYSYVPSSPQLVRFVDMPPTGLSFKIINAVP